MTATHTKVNEEGYSEYGCMDICRECSQWSWEEREGGVVTWAECLDNRAIDEFDIPQADGQGYFGGE